jgi:hypothetical protein
MAEDQGDRVSIDFEKLQREDLISRWQRRRMFCLKLAAKLGAASPEQAIEWAEKIGDYILHSRMTGPTKSG